MSCTALYAPPEAVNALEAGAEIVVNPSLDIWAIGVILFESLSGRRAFHVYSAVEEVHECAEGIKPYAWEGPVEQLPAGWRRSRARELFSKCLSRDPAARPSALQLLQGLHRLSDSTSVW